MDQKTMNTPSRPKLTLVIPQEVVHWMSIPPPAELRLRPAIHSLTLPAVIKYEHFQQLSQVLSPSPQSTLSPMDLSHLDWTNFPLPWNLTSPKVVNSTFFPPDSLAGKVIAVVREDVQIR
ncbi:hypothetical protein FRB90_001189 [Tulasnella sp. 427]|nr:hypothetical protein FRB90_001189 [Tulasnella sp. 427]